MSDTIEPSQKARVRGIQYESQAGAAQAKDEKAPHLFSGVAVSFDVAGAAMMLFAPYGQFEAAARMNLKERFFPIVEAGIGASDHTDDGTDLHYKVASPYFRLGCDYNFAKNLKSGNRIYGGLRFAFSSFKYDLSGPPITDPVWGDEMPFVFPSVAGRMQWAEFVFGLEAKIWKFVHLGWSFRYRLRLNEKQNEIGRAWYVPGYGKNDSHALGGTFNLIFDI